MSYLAGGIRSGVRLRRTAYVLDDQPQVAAAVCRILDTIGFAPRQFTSSQPFLKETTSSPPDVIVLDLALGQSDAVEIIKQLHAIRFKGRVLLISGLDDAPLTEIKKIGERHGLSMMQPLSKPFRARDLQNALSVVPPPKEIAWRRASSGQEPVAIDVKIDLPEALQNDWLELWYQPKFDLKSLRVCGAEALLRAQHPEHGLLLPAHVLPEPGDVLHQALAGFVLRRAMSDWNTFASSNVWTKIAVNMPLSVIVAPQFVRAVRDTLPRQAEFPGLIVEVTEDEVIHDPELIHEVATQLQVYGVSISVDDFGEGYSSLGRLNSLPFVELKIDRSFVFNCAEDPLKQTICQTIVDLGHRLNATVCAEGVETLADLKAVVKLGCDTAQGFLFSKPMPAAEFLDLASVYGRLQNRDSEALKS